MAGAVLDGVRPGPQSSMVGTWRKSACQLVSSYSSLCKASYWTICQDTLAWYGRKAMARITPCTAAYPPRTKWPREAQVVLVGSGSHQP
jgi:hypothetical protein